MKKILAITCLLMGGFFIGGCSYYNDTYKGVIAYAKIPEQIPEKTETKDNNGEIQEGLYSYNYDFEFVTADGKKEKMDYELSGENPSPYTPNSYIKVKISKKRILEGPKSVDESQIPNKALQILKKGE